MTAMPSKQSEAVKRRWEMARMAMEQPGFEPPDDESWGDLTAEPRGVDYLETEAGGRPAMWAIPKRSDADRVLLCMHGGGFVGGSIYTHRKMFGHLAKAAGARALLVSYRLLPEGVYPAPVDDVEAAYRWLLGPGDRSRPYRVRRGLGRGLARDHRPVARPGPRPAAAGRGAADLTLDGPGGQRGIVRDQPARTRSSSFRPCAGSRGTSWAGPLIPAIRWPARWHADLSGLGPVYIQVGGDETLLDDARRLDAQARKADVDVRLDVFPGMLHTFQMAAGRAPEADDAIRGMAGWVRPRLGL